MRAFSSEWSAALRMLSEHDVRPRYVDSRRVCGEILVTVRRSRERATQSRQNFLFIKLEEPVLVRSRLMNPHVIVSGIGVFLYRVDMTSRRQSSVDLIRNVISTR